MKEKLKLSRLYINLNPHSCVDEEKRQPGSMNLDLYVNEAVKLQTNWAENERSKRFIHAGSGSKNGVEPDPNIYLIRIYSCKRIDQYEHDL
ncbi:hypothetical protein N665_0069s0058 [Sinapis alba]|nr:hypothetical protein N665_0069s0058 [Sinapis alba]